MAAIRAYVSAERANAGLDTHNRQDAVGDLKKAKQRLYEIARDTCATS